MKAIPYTPNPVWLTRKGGGGTGGAGKFQRTLVIKNAKVGTDIADHVTAYASGTATRIVGVLRIAIAADLTVMVKKNDSDFVEITIPAGTLVDDPVTQSTFVGSKVVTDNDVFSWDITASGGEKDATGVATFTLEWA